MNKQWESMEKSGYVYVKSIGNGEHILRDIDDDKLEVWFNSKHHASYGIIWNNTHLEFARSYNEPIDLGITICKLNKELPHGSGIDCKWEIEDKRKYFKCCNSFHCMNENGYYDGYADFTLIIPKKNPKDFKLHFNGDYAQKKNNKYQLRDYLEEMFDYAIEQMITPKQYQNSYQMDRLIFKENHLLSDFLVYLVPYVFHKPNYKPIQFAKNSYIGSYLQVIDLRNRNRQTKSFDAMATDIMVKLIKDNMIAVDYDTITFELYLYDNGTAMLTANYGQIIGSHWISLIDMNSIPEICKA